MPRIRTTFAIGIVSIALVTLGGCSKSQDAASSDTTATDSTTAAVADSGAAASSEAAAASAAPDNTTPAVTKVSLDIKDAAGAPVSGDPVSGAAVFTQCETCHSKDPGVNKVGPSLHGIIGRHSGMIPNFNYSSANKGSGIVWTEQELYAYLENPQKVVPGTYMTFTGVKDPQKRADVIAFLQENTK
jgi:cytochrome c